MTTNEKPSDITGPLTRNYLVNLVDRLDKFQLDANTPEPVRQAILTARREAWDALLSFPVEEV